MKNFGIFGLFFLLCGGAWAEQPLSRCEARDRAFYSKSLSNGPENPRKVSYRVFLPKGYDQTRRYGVVYFLHGYDSDHRMLDHLGFCAQLDREMERDGSEGFIVVAPEGGNNYWMNGALSGERWGDMVTRDLISEVEAGFPVIRGQRGRVIAGISMGGHGAFQLSLNHPGLYGAVAGHSPVFRTQEQANRDFPRQFGTGRSYQERDPLSLVTVGKKRLNVPVWLDMGGADPWVGNTRVFSQELRKTGAKATIEIEADPAGGKHDSEYWKSRLSGYIRWYSRNLSRPERSGGECSQEQSATEILKTPEIENIRDIADALKNTPEGP